MRLVIVSVKTGICSFENLSCKIFHSEDVTAGREGKVEKEVHCIYLKFLIVVNMVNGHII